MPAVRNRKTLKMPKGTMSDTWRSRGLKPKSAIQSGRRTIISTPNITSDQCDRTQRDIYPPPSSPSPPPPLPPLPPPCLLSLALLVGYGFLSGGDNLFQRCPIFIGKVLDARAGSLVGFTSSQSSCNGEDFRSCRFDTTVSQQPARDVRCAIVRTGQIGEEGDSSLFAVYRRRRSPLPESALIVSFGSFSESGSSADRRSPAATRCPPVGMA